MKREHEPAFFYFQRRAMDVLLAWGFGSILVGAACLLSRSAGVRQAGIQAIAWGAIDALIAFFGQRGALRQLERGEPAEPQARRFRLIVLINVVLDVGYVAGGVALVRRSGMRQDRVGMGVGIVLQGLFLFFFDTALAILVGRYTRT